LGQRTFPTIVETLFRSSYFLWLKPRQLGQLSNLAQPSKSNKRRIPQRARFSFQPGRP
jgi:hypothetical protein